MKRFAIALFSTLALATSAAHAIEYNQVQADKSKINFGYQQMGVSMDGSFKTFSSQLRFDPAAPQTRERFGLWFVRSLAQQVRGELDLSSGPGFCARLVFPFADGR